MNKYKLTEINIYPIKSLGGISLQSSVVEERGLKYDRRWMLVDENNKFFTQRTHPQMALLQVNINNDQLIVSHKKNKLNLLTISPAPENGTEADVQIWDDTVAALKYSSEINDWFSEAIGCNCSLVLMPESTKRKVNKKYAPEKTVSFADAYPFLIIGEESLNDLNSRLSEPVPMLRFRPNLVFSGGEPFDEDSWNNLKIGTINFKAVKPCPRCIITTIDQQTGIKGKEPLKTLSTYRRKDGNVMFGINLICYGAGVVSVGDQILQTD